MKQKAHATHLYNYSCTGTWNIDTQWNRKHVKPSVFLYWYMGYWHTMKQKACESHLYSSTGIWNIGTQWNRKHVQPICITIPVLEHEILAHNETESMWNPSVFLYWYMEYWHTMKQKARATHLYNYSCTGTWNIDTKWNRKHVKPIRIPVLLYGVLTHNKIHMLNNWLLVKH